MIYELERPVLCFFAGSSGLSPLVYAICKNINLYIVSFEFLFCIATFIFEIPIFDATFT